MENQIDKRKETTVTGIIVYMGGPDRMASKLGVTVGAISHWKVKGLIPADRAIQIEEITKGKLRAVRMPRAEL
ncbi:MAG: helix-turn-helix domain-containing protein [Rhizobiaceae bacterium]|nr:helix-turn-helix domain-containing protein [Rhizobiaceae bacterium]